MNPAVQGEEVVQCAQFGPSPRVWGKRCDGTHRSQAWRSTPTRVGKTSVDSPFMTSLAVHPHACGENTYHAFSVAQPSSPPPRVWGKLFAPVDTGALRRSTPTRVGKTWSICHSILVVKVHPHACGENVNSPAPDFSSRGPPPRVWGKQKNSGSKYAAKWSTPTRVGKTGLSRKLMISTVLHPHACGENGVAGSFVPYWGGPPPRVWGKLVTISLQAQSRRSTPTRVGKTFAIVNRPDVL